MPCLPRETIAECELGKANLRAAILGCLVEHAADRLKACEICTQLYMIKEANGW